GSAALPRLSTIEDEDADTSLREALSPQVASASKQKVLKIARKTTPPGVLMQRCCTRGFVDGHPARTMHITRVALPSLHIGPHKDPRNPEKCGNQRIIRKHDILCPAQQCAALGQIGCHGSFIHERIELRIAVAAVIVLVTSAQHI